MGAHTDAVVVTRVTALKLEISTAFQLVDAISNWMAIFADEDDITAAQLSQLEQIDNLLSTSKAGATYYFARLPCLYSAVEKVFCVNYQVDVGLPIVQGDAYQVAARMDRAIWYLNHVVIQELVYVWGNIGNVGIFPNGPGAILSSIMNDLVNMHLLIGSAYADCHGVQWLC